MPVTTAANQAIRLLIAIENGRLGNMLFQYAALRDFAPHAAFLLVGMDDLRCTFDGVRASRFSLSSAEQRGPRLWRRRAQYLSRLVTLLAHLRILSTAEEAESASGPVVRVRPGLLRTVAVARSGYFQTESLASTKSGRELRLKSEWRVFAENILINIPGDINDKYFVHVRRGDYTSWPTRDNPAVIPLKWYLAQMDRIRTRNPAAVFIVTSDDKPYVDEFLSGLPGVHIVHLGPIEDFAVMTRCLGGGIVSASTFAWWASFLVRNDSPDAYFVGPRYWAGHMTGHWLPSGIETSWIDYATVP